MLALNHHDPLSLWKPSQGCIRGSEDREAEEYPEQVVLGTVATNAAYIGAHGRAEQYRSDNGKSYARVAFSVGMRTRSGVYVSSGIKLEGLYLLRRLRVKTRKTPVHELYAFNWARKRNTWEAEYEDMIKSEAGAYQSMPKIGQVESQLYIAASPLTPSLYPEINPTVTANVANNVDCALDAWWSIKTPSWYSQMLPVTAKAKEIYRLLTVTETSKNQQKIALKSR
ncbi:hypothetical protein BDY19DRAFT_908087 [Irpex rosettiformis]|uniref:Uncharacterized protein n=1 Tax=Irpex rosettiformis TaxID=378272 RepID=A0ACB8TXC7_9APHY|nr:hypothetical protein BDY19DRAFT_908087 [Irpex rosettiformis]